jgi:hypothetical protein
MFIHFVVEKWKCRYYFKPFRKCTYRCAEIHKIQAGLTTVYKIFLYTEY